MRGLISCIVFVILLGISAVCPLLGLPLLLVCDALGLVSIEL